MTASAKSLCRTISIRNFHLQIVNVNKSDSSFVTKKHLPTINVPGVSTTIEAVQREVQAAHPHEGSHWREALRLQGESNPSSLSPTSDSVTLEDHLMGSKGFPTHVGLPIEIWPQGFSWNLNLAANEHISYTSWKRAKWLSFATNWSEQCSSGRRLQPVFCSSWELEDSQSVSKSWKNCYIENRKLISTWLWRHLTKVMFCRFLEYNS